MYRGANNAAARARIERVVELVTANPGITADDLRTMVRPRATRAEIRRATKSLHLERRITSSRHGKGSHYRYYSAAGRVG